LITVESQRCVGGRTVVNVSQSQFSIDDPAGVAAKSLSWHVPVRVSAGEAPSDPVLTENGRATITAAGCGPLLINPGQTGYFRTLYRPDQRVALAQGFGSLQPVDQYGVMDEQLSLAEAGYQPMGAALDILAKVGADADPGVIGAALSNWGALYRTLNRNKPAQRQLRDRAIRTFEPRLKQLGLTPSAGESARDSILRQRLIVTLGTFDDPLVLSEAKRLSIALRTNPSALSGPLKQSWLQIISSNASASDWDTLHQLAQRAPAMVDRIDYYQALGNAQSKALAEKTLALAMSAEPGPQISPGIMQAVARQDPGLALDYALARLDQLKSLIDLSASSQFIARLAANSDDPSLITKLNDYAKANVADSDRRPLDQAIERIRWRSSTNPRIARETAAWLAKHKR
jgi:aminopeptidase N